MENLKTEHENIVKAMLTIDLLKAMVKKFIMARKLEFLLVDKKSYSYGCQRKLKLIRRLQNCDDKCFVITLTLTRNKRLQFDKYTYYLN